LRLDDHLVFYVPTARAVNPVTGTNWEGVGVTPDIDSDPSSALQRAHVLALESLLTALPDHPRADARKRALESAKK
jgi:hypothetical protein